MFVNKNALTNLTSKKKKKQYLTLTFNISGCAMSLVDMCCSNNSQTRHKLEIRAQISIEIKNVVNHLLLTIHV